MNPGAPPPPPGYGWAPVPAGYPMAMKSTTPKTLGTLSIVFGAIVGAMSLLNLVIGKSFSTISVQPSQRPAFEKYLDEIHTYSLVQAAVLLAMSLALVAIGLGQRGYKRWAVGASVTWGLVALLVVVGQLVGAFVAVMPALETFTRAISHGGVQTGPIVMGAKIGTFLGIAFYAPFPLILISSFRKPHNLAAMDQ